MWWDFVLLAVEFLYLLSFISNLDLKGEVFVFYVFKLRNFIVFNNQPSSADIISL